MPQQYNNKLLLTFLTLLVCLPNSGLAENYIKNFKNSHSKFLRLATGEGKDIELRYLIEPDTDSDEDLAGEFSLNQLLFSAELPLPVSRDFFWRLAPTYSARFYDFESVNILGIEVEAETFHEVQLGLGFGNFFYDNFLLTAMLRPGIYSDFDRSLNGDQIKLFGEVIFIYAYSDNLQAIIGVVSDELFDELRAYPVVGIRYKSLDDKFHLKLTPPVEIRLGYYLLSDFQIYSQFEISGQEYRAHNSAGVDFDVQIQDKRLGLGALYWLEENLNISLEIGANLKSKFEFEIDNMDLPNEQSDTSFYSLFSLGYTL